MKEHVEFGGQYTVLRRKPDVRFGKPDRFMSGYRMSGFRTSECQSSERPDFERPDRLLSDVRDQNLFQTGSKLVWNRFWSIRTIRTSRTSDNRKYLSGYRTFGKLTLGCLKSGHSITGRFFVRFAKPDVRYSALHCSTHTYLVKK